MADREEVLDPSCLRDLVVEIHSAQAKWYNLGLQLGVAAHTLDTIRIQCMDQQQDCQRDMLKEWLRQGEATRNRLTKALNSPTVREHRLAREVGRATPAREVAGNTPTQDDDSECNDIVPYGCGCGECSFGTYLLRGCPQPTPSTSSFPFLLMDHLTTEQQYTLTGRLYDDFEQISFKFSRFTRSVCESLIARDVPLKTLVRSLRDLKAFQPTYSDSPLLQDRFKELRAAQDIDDVFDILTDYTSFFNHSLLEHIVQEHGEDKDKEALICYHEKLMEFCRRGIFECPVYTAPQRGLATLVLKVEDEVVERGNLKHLGQLTSRVSKALCLTEYCLQLCSVQRGCVCLVYELPPWIPALLFPLSPGKQRDLNTVGVIRLTCDTHHYTLPSVQSQTTVDHPLTECHATTVCEWAVLERHPWYHGNITRQEAEERLQATVGNRFLLRRKDGTPGLYTLSESYNGQFKHYLVQRGDRGGGYEIEGQRFNTLPLMVQYLQQDFHFKPCARTVMPRDNSAQLLLESDWVAMVKGDEGTGDSGFGTGSGDDGFTTALPTISGCGQEGCGQEGCGQERRYTSLQQDSLLAVKGVYQRATSQEGNTGYKYLRDIRH